MTMQVVASLSNTESLVIGEITDAEAALALADDPTMLRSGLFLIQVDRRDPRAPGRVVARFTSADAAAKLAQFFRISGRIEDKG
ncbi:hypothetical protein [Aureimonas psammosilenae]|uniref:hypothetical protein n=1 Tax=Aureimonas psammosilenae TaxID=2495496 RepID=UPI0012605290|nr:hypothetical protein [Aureimonas psammosilenae]